MGRYMLLTSKDGTCCTSVKPVQGVGSVRIKIDPSPLSEITIVFSKAFDMLERLDPNPEYWEGKRGACVGVFQMIIAG